MQSVPGRRLVVITFAALVAIGCGRSGLERLSQSRQLSADLHLQFTRAADAANKMSASEAAARRALEALGPLVSAGSRPKLAAAAADLNRFMAVNAEITALSRRNTNVHSLALTLNEKGQLTRACEDSLRALRDALARRGFSGTR